MAVLEDSTFTQHKIANIRRVVCAAPAYLDAKGQPRTPADLLQHECLLLRFPGSKQFRWTLRDGDDLVTVPVSGSCDADDGDVLTDWALNGQGLLLKPLFEVAPYIADQRLRIVLPEYPPQSVELAVLYPSRKMLSRRVRDLVDAIHTAARQHLVSKLARLGEKL